MALWGISTTTETDDNRYGLPKHLSENDRENTPWNCFADNRGWVYRRYGTSEQSGLSGNYYDEVLVPVAGLNTGTDSPGNGVNNTGLGTATPVAVFFEDPNKNSRFSVSAGATTGFSTTGTAYVHVVWNETVYCSAGATVRLLRSTGTPVVATAGSIANGTDLAIFTNSDGYQIVSNYNGQISNRVAFAFTSNNSGVGTIFRIDMSAGVVGTITDFSGAGDVNKTFPSTILRQIGGAGTITDNAVGIGTTVLTLFA